MSAHEKAYQHIKLTMSSLFLETTPNITFSNSSLDKDETGLP